MLKDVFIPSKFGSYYIYGKKILAFECTNLSIQASLLSFSGNNINLENSMVVVLQDQSSVSIINALKKIITNIGTYDQIVTSFSGSAVIFKELTVSFIGREKIKMILDYEIESLLPFALQDAVIDFIITEENKEKQQTTVLIAAIKKSDLDEQLSYFQKADIKIDVVTLDMFAIYNVYSKYFMPVTLKQTMLIVNFTTDSISIMYIQQGILKSVRLISYGLLSMINKLNEPINDIVKQRILDHLLSNIKHEDQDDLYHHISQEIITKFCKQIELSISFFKKQLSHFITPEKIICFGVGSLIYGFKEDVTHLCNLSLDIIDIKKIIHMSHIQVSSKYKYDIRHSGSVMTALLASDIEDINYIADVQHRNDNHLLYKQFITLVTISCASLCAVYFYSQYQLGIWNIEYNGSKKEMIRTLQDQMDLDVKSMKRVTDIVQAAQAKLEQAKKVCFSFSRSNHSFLHYLQDLSSKIDRESLGLNLKKLSMHDKEITLQGKVKDFDVLETFGEELMELKNFSLKSKLPGELMFTVTLQAHDNQEIQ